MTESTWNSCIFDPDSIALSRNGLYRATGRHGETQVSGAEAQKLECAATDRDPLNHLAI